MFVRNRAAVPRHGRIAGSAIIDERKALAFWILEPQCEPSITFEDFAVRHTMVVEASHPPLQRVVTADAQTRTNDTAGAATLAWDWPIEESQVGPGVPFASA